MDGNVDPAPTQAWCRADVKQWLEDHEIAVPGKATKTQLLELVQFNYVLQRLATIEIADGFHHEVQFTPPYHLAFQPIEMVWGQLRTPKDFNKCMEELRRAC
ncbi:TPA: hypothetical protein N0F65_011509 [Lagenidium giganteum]|uniref:Uncharacterized protein n=1 Tax=Lagenidium giganteum TaxID=4803 RepID=A0AAV2Z3M3_9STRA|nr:TPA: hypothetical protein N0F65_011509 [Lagenidium giganteum]